MEPASLIKNGITYVTARTAAPDAGISADYITKLCRKGDVDAALVGNTWYVNRTSLAAFVARKEAVKNEQAVRLAQQQKEQHRQTAARTQLKHQPPPNSLPEPDVTSNVTATPLSPARQHLHDKAVRAELFAEREAKKRGAHFHSVVLATITLLIATSAAALGSDNLRSTFASHLPHQLVAAARTTSSFITSRAHQIADLDSRHSFSSHSQLAQAQQSFPQRLNEKLRNAFCRYLSLGCDATERAQTAQQLTTSPVFPAQQSATTARELHETASMFVQSKITATTPENVSSTSAPQQPPRSDATQSAVTSPTRYVTITGITEALLDTRIKALELLFDARLSALASAHSYQTIRTIENLADATRIDSLSASVISGTITNVIDSASATIASLTTNTFVATSASTTALSVSATTTTNGLVIGSLDCSSLGNGGTLTTGANGTVICATDDGGSGATVAGSDTQVQFNNAGAFGASSSFTFASSSQRLAVPFASTTAFSATSLCLSSDCRTGWPVDTSFATTSADYWKTERNFFSTTSAEYWGGTKGYATFGYLFPSNATSTLLSFNGGLLSVGSTTINGNATTTGMLGVGSLYLNTERFTDLTGSGLTNSGGVLSLDTTGNWTGTFDGLDGAAYLAASFSTTSANYWQTTRDFFSTTSVSHFASLGLAFSTTSANYFAHSSTTIPKTYTANSFTALQTFTNASSTLFSSVYASSTNLFAGTFTLGSLNGPLQANNGVVSATSSILAIYGGTGQTSYAVGDILYASAAGTLTKLPIGSTGTVLKVSGGVPTWGTDLTSGGGGGAGAWATTSDSLAVYPTDTTDVIIVGATATATANSIFEVFGRSYFSNNLGIGTTSPGARLSVEGSSLVGNTATAGYFVATTSTASQLPYASTTMITAATASSTSLYISGTSGAVLKTTANGQVAAAVAGTDYIANTIGDWTGVFDGLEGTAYLANSFSTTSASYFSSLGLAFSTTSADAWKNARNFFATTSADYWEAQQTARSADDLSNNSIEELNDVAAITENYGDLFAWNGASWADVATTSLAIALADTTGTLGGTRGGTGLSTISAAGILVGNYTGTGWQQLATSSLGILTTHVAEGSNLYFTDARVQSYLDTVAKSFFFSTSSASYFLAQNQGSAFSTTSASHFASLGLAFSTTSNDYWKGVTNFFSTTSAQHFVHSSTTIPKTYAANSFTALQTFTNASSTHFSSTYASTTNFFGAGLALCQSNNVLTWSNGLFGCEADDTGAGGAYPFFGTGNATSTLTQFNGGITAYASSTIGNGTASGGLTISGNATTSGNVLVLGSTALQQFTFLNATGTSATTTNLRSSVFSLGSHNGPLHANGGLVSATTSIGVFYGGTGLATAPSYGQLLLGNTSGAYTLIATSSLGLQSVLQGTQGQTAYFSGNNTALGTSSLFIATTGNVGIGTTTPVEKLSILSGDNTSSTNIFAARANNLTQGIGVGYNTIRSLGTNQPLTFDTNGTGSLTLQTGGASRLTVDGTTGNVGIGTTSPFSKLSVHANNGETLGTLFLVSSSTASATSTLFSIFNSGNVAIGTSTASAKLEVSGALVTGGEPANLDPAQNLDDAILSNLVNSGKFAVGWNRTGGHGETDFVTNRGGGLVGGFNFYDYTNAGTLSHLVTIAGDGRTGIASSTPWRTLSVVGTAAIDGLTSSATGNYVCINTTTWQLTRGNGSACTTSSARFKDDIADLDYGLNEVVAMRAVSFRYKSDMNMGAAKRVGFIAEEMQLLVPEVVNIDETGRPSGIDYPSLTAVLAKAIAELANKVSETAHLIVATITATLGHFDRIETKELCVGSVCVTESQFLTVFSTTPTNSTIPTGASPTDASPPDASPTDAPQSPPVAQLSQAAAATIPTSATSSPSNPATTSPHYPSATTAPESAQIPSSSATLAPQAHNHLTDSAQLPHANGKEIAPASATPAAANDNPEQEPVSSGEATPDLANDNPLPSTADAI